MQNDPDILKQEEQYFESSSSSITSEYPLERLNEPPEENWYSNPLEISETCEALTKFLTSQGLPLESIQDKMFQNLFYSLNPKKTILTPEILKDYTVKMGNPMKYQQALSKSTGPLSVTIDVIEKENGDNYLTFSIHFFEGFEERKCLINLKKLLISEIEAESILTAIRRALSILIQDQVEISNFVVPNERMFEMLKPYNDGIKHHFISFHHYLRTFVENILKIRPLFNGINQLRKFVAFVKTTPFLYAEFRRCQSMNEEIPDIPDLDDQNSWISTATFLTKFLILHPTFETLVKRWDLSYITSIAFGKLKFLFQLLQQCIKHAKDLSGPLNSISQVIPAFKSIRNYIFENLSHGDTFETDIRSAFYNTFQELTRGQMSRRYDIATILDPRFAYDNSIYPNRSWSDIEKAVIKEIVEVRQSNNEPRQERTIKIQKELIWYRRMCNDRPNESANPFQWWNSHKDNLENLSLIAREYLACPAVSIDAQQFFGSGGKFSNLVEIYDSKSLESYLNCAGHHQQFLGHGSNIEHIPEQEIVILNQNFDAKRDICHGLSDPGSVTEEASPSNKIPEILPKDVKLEPVDLEDTVEDLIDPANPESSIEKEIKKLDVYALEDVKLEFKDPVENKLEQMDYPYTLIEKEHNYQKATPTTEDIKPDVELFDDNYEPLEMKPDIEVLNLPEEGNFEPFYDDYGIIKGPPIRQHRVVNRKCVLCENICPQEYLKVVTADNLKLFLLLGSVLGQRIEVISANEIYSEPQLHSFYCRSHFQESCIAILNELRVESPFNILDCVEVQFENILKLILSIRNMRANFEEAKSFVASMIAKHYNVYEVFPVNDKEIVPFTRKSKKATMGSYRKQKAKCRFCLKSTFTSKMTSAPKSYGQLQKWIEILGKEFGSCLKLNGERNLICRSHFSRNAFSRNGRRLIGMMPEIGLDNDKQGTSKDEESEHSENPSDSAPPRPRGRPRKYPKIDEEDETGSQGSELIPRKKRICEGPLLDYQKPWRTKKPKLEDDEFEETTCRFCSEVVNKTEAFKGNKNWIRLSEWNKYLGVDFVRSLDYRNNNYVCMKHFKTDENDLDRLPKQTTSSSHS